MNTTNSLVSQRLVQLKASGVAPVAAIKTIHLEFGLPLAEAKHAFALSPAWAREAANGDQLHQELLAELGKDQES
jgi:hypothetical protein